MEVVSLPPETEPVYHDRQSKLGAEVVVFAAGTEPFRGEGFWWHKGQGTRLPVVRQENRLRYYGPAWTYIEVLEADKQ